MTEPDRRPALLDAYRLAAEVVAGVEPAQVSQPTCCTEYDVAALVDHLVGAGHRAAVLGRGQAPSGEAFPHVALTEAPDELRRAGQDAGKAWADDSRLEATVTMEWGEAYRGANLVDMYLAELATHAWDLATATGQSLGDDDLARVALEAARAMLRPEYRDMMGVGNPFGAEQPAGDDATTLERFAAFLGRRIHWQP